MADGSDRDWLALREAQAAACTQMTQFELQAFRLGCPPGQTCVATPESYRNACQLGVVDIGQMPLNLAISTIEGLYGTPSRVLNFSGDFARATGSTPESNPAPTPFPFLNRDYA